MKMNIADQWDPGVDHIVLFFSGLKGYDIFLNEHGR